MLSSEASRIKDAHTLAGDLVTTRGDPWPPGTHERRGGVNIAIFSRHATQMALLLFDGDPLSGKPAQRIELDPAITDSAKCGTSGPRATFGAKSMRFKPTDLAGCGKDIALSQVCPCWIPMRRS